MPRKQETVNRWNLITSEDSYSSQDSQLPNSSRRVLSLIPTRSGLVTRELGEATFLPGNLSGTVGSIFQYDWNNGAGAKHSIQLAATATQLFVNTVSPATPNWSPQTLPMNTGLTSATPFTDYPQFCVINGILHFSDGATNWILSGPDSVVVSGIFAGQYFIEGFPIPLFAPGIVSTASAGAITATIGKYYWYTFASDFPAGVIHESSSSPISASTGAIAAKQVTVSAQVDTLNTTIGSTAVVSIGGGFRAGHVGMALYVLGAQYGIITAFTDNFHVTISTGAIATNAGATYLIAPVRATHIHWYGSETDGSKLGKYHGTMPVTTSPPNFIDNSPFVNQANSTILDIDRPVRNDPAPTSKIIEVHKNRIFRRRESKPSFFNFSAYEEVLSGTNGSPFESVPGAATNTLSDIINEDPYPKPSNRIRALKSHADALYIGTEKDTTPLYGDSIDTFGLSQVTAVSNGIISRWGMESTPHGLVLFTYDRKMLLYPPVSPIYAVTPNNMNVTDQLQEIGLAMRNKFLAIKNADQDNCRILWYNYNTRDWLVVCFQDNASVYHTYVYDFSTKGWFELQRGFASVAIFEPIAGQKVLVGGGTDGFVYVIDDLQGTYTNATLPLALFRTALIDFGHPDMLHVPDYMEYEVSSAAMADSTTVNFYLDPTDADNPTGAIPLPMTPVPNRPNLFRGFFAAAASQAGAPGVLCKRLMIELNVASDTNAGSYRGVMLKADPVQNLFQ